VELFRIGANTLNPPPRVLKPRGSELHFSLLACPRQDTAVRPCKSSGNINQSIEPSLPRTLQHQSHTGASPEAVTSRQNSFRDVFQVTRETALYGFARTSDWNRCNKSSSDLRGWRFLMWGRALERQYPHNGPVISRTARIQHRCALGDCGFEKKWEKKSSVGDFGNGSRTLKRQS
jgi:hypothetical protein